MEQVVEGEGEGGVLLSDLNGSDSEFFFFFDQTKLVYCRRLQFVKSGNSHNRSTVGERTVTDDLRLCLYSACWLPHLPACAAWHRLQFVLLECVLTSSRTVALADGSHAERLSALGVR